MGNDAITSLRLVPSLEVATKEYLPVEVDPVIEQILELPGVIAVLDVSGRGHGPWGTSNHTEFLDIYVSNLGDFVQTKTSLSTAGKIVKWSDREMELTLELWETSVSATEIVNSACLIHWAKPYVLERGESRDRVLTPSSFALTSESLGQLLTLHYSPEAASSVIWELSNFDETGTGVMSAEKLRAEIFSHITTAVNRVCGDLGCHKKQWTEAELVHPVEQMKLLRWEPLEYSLFESSLANQDPSPMSDGESDVMDDLSLWFHDYVHLHREDFSVVGKFPDLSGLPKKKLRYTKKIRSLFTQDPELRSKFWEGDELRIGYLNRAAEVISDYMHVWSDEEMEAFCHLIHESGRIHKLYPADHVHFPEVHILHLLLKVVEVAQVRGEGKEAGAFFLDLNQYANNDIVFGKTLRLFIESGLSFTTPAFIWVAAFR